MRHAKLLEAQILGFYRALGKRGRDKLCGSDDSSVGGVVSRGNVIRKIRKEYYALGMLLEFQSSGNGDGEEFAPPGKEREERLKAESDSDEYEDGEAKEHDPSLSPEVDRKNSKDRGLEGKRTTDKDANRTRTAN